MTDLLGSVAVLGGTYAAVILASVAISSLISMGGVPALITIWAALAVALVVINRA